MKDHLLSQMPSQHECNGYRSFGELQSICADSEGSTELYFA